MTAPKDFEAQLCVPYWEQMSFAEEMIDRSGGLALAGHAGGTGRATQYNFVLPSVRSWEKTAELMRRRVEEYRAKGWTVTVFGSKAGCPKRRGARVPVFREVLLHTVHLTGTWTLAPRHPSGGRSRQIPGRGSILCVNIGIVGRPVRHVADAAHVHAGVGQFRGRGMGPVVAPVVLVHDELTAGLATAEEDFQFANAGCQHTASVMVNRKQGRNEAADQYFGRLNLPK